MDTEQKNCISSLQRHDFRSLQFHADCNKVADVPSVLSSQVFMALKLESNELSHESPKEIDFDTIARFLNVHLGTDCNTFKQRVQVLSNDELHALKLILTLRIQTK